VSVPVVHVGYPFALLIFIAATSHLSMPMLNLAALFDTFLGRIGASRQASQATVIIAIEELCCCSSRLPH
jgi:hypothetical protein